MRWISSTDLHTNSSSKIFETLLPELIRKLIIASCSTFPDVHIPIGDSIYKPGWDGQCDVKEKYLFVPKGKSLWEWGRDQDFLGKCNREFKKRTTETDLQIREDSTFIFVTPKRWINKKLNKEQKQTILKNKKSWLDIKIYDADDLELWIEKHPAIGLWLAQKLRLMPSKNIEAADHFWKNFTNTKEFKISPDLIIAGRKIEKSQIQHFLNGDYGTLEVQATSDTEAIAFVIASIVSDDDKTLQTFFNKAIIITGKDELREVTSSQENLVIIYNSQGNEAIENPSPNLNHVINTVDFKVNTRGVSVPIPNSESFNKSLESLGLDWEKSNSLSRQCGRSFSVLRRILADVPGRVSWTENKDIQQLIPIFILQKVDSRKKGDRLLVEMLSKKSFEEYEVEIKEWSLIFDKPVYVISNYWRVVSPYDLFFVIAKYLTTGHLQMLEQAMMKALCEIDPALELEPNMRFASSLFEKETAFSNKCKEGICHTLILISLFGEKAGMIEGTNLSNWVDSAVKKLLSSQELPFWQSIESKVHLLAEASPYSFLSALENVIQNNPTVISSMFNDENYDLFSPTYHTHILWSLESLAWDSKHFSRVIFILASLVELDTGKETANRPLNSLRYIFILWLPQTHVSLENRNQVIESLIKRKEVIAFQLLKEIAPRNNDTGYYSHKPIWRNRENTSTKPTNDEWQKGLAFICDKIIEVTSTSIDRWVEIIDLIDDFHGENRAKLIDALSSINFKSDTNISLFREKLREFIWRHENYSDQDWSISNEDLKRLKSCYSKLIYNDIDKYYWYFNVDTIKKRKSSRIDYNDLVKQTNELRQEALFKINSSLGFQGLVNLASIVNRPWVVGYNLASISTDHENQLIEFLANKSAEKQYQLAQGYVYRAHELNGFDWVNVKVDYINSKVTNTHLLVNFFSSLSPDRKIWKLLEEISPEAASLFWEKAYKHDSALDVSPDDLNLAIEILNSKKRFTTSLNLIRSDLKETPAKLIVDTLKGLATHPIEENVHLHLGSYTIIELFKRLDLECVDKKSMQKLEWLYISILNDSRKDRSIKHLYEALKESPSFFSEILSWFYIPESKSPKEEIKKLNPEFVENRAKNAHELLSSWASLPYTNSEGIVDIEKLHNWINEAIEECTKRDRKEKGYYELGKLFGRINETYNNWPQAEICDLIEQIDNEKLNEGFIIGLINGSEIKASFRPANSSRPERNRAKKYQTIAEDLSFKYPKVSKLVMEVSKDYENWANYIDTDNQKKNLDA